MNTSRLHFALREWRGHMRHPTTLVILAAAVLLLAVTSPFALNNHLSLVEATLYWAWIVLATYSVGFVANALLGRGWWRFLASSVTITLAVAVIVGGTNWTVFGFVPMGRDAWIFLATTAAICVIVNGVFLRLDSHHGQSDTRTPAILDRLPIERRGNLVSLSVEDHYVRVRTVRGEEMVLIRLRDAIVEAEPCRGLQVHRSHWVALAQVTGARRVGDRAVLSMSHGPEIPVSRASLAAARKAGLLTGAGRG